MSHKLISFNVVVLIQTGFLFGMLPLCIGQAARTAGSNNLRAVAMALQPVLLAGKEGSRLEYAARCPADPGGFSADLIPFPEIKIKMPERGQSGVAAVGAIFSDDKEVRVAEYVPGVIDIKMGRVSDGILGVRISSLKLRRAERYDPATAIGAIEETKEVQAFMRRNNISLPPELGGLMTQPSPYLPHLKAHLTDLTVGEALDSIAKTFGGIVVYGACESPRNLFYIDFYSLRGGL